MKLFKLRCAKPLMSDKRTALVLAPNAKAAIACMTFGSDSCWMAVYSCQELDEEAAKQHLRVHFLGNAEGFILGMV